MQTMSAVGRKATLAGIPERSRAGWAALPFSLSPSEPWTAGPSLPEHCLPRMGPAVPCPRTPGLGTSPRGHTDVSLNVSVLGGPRSYTPCPGLPVMVRLCATAWPRPTSSRPPGVAHSPLARAPLRPLSSALCTEPLALTADPAFAKHRALSSHRTHAGHAHGSFVQSKSGYTFAPVNNPFSTNHRVLMPQGEWREVEGPRMRGRTESWF